MKKMRGILLTAAAVVCLAGTGAAGAYASETPAEAEATAAEAALVQTNWWDNLPRESWSQFEKVDVGDDWYSVYKMPGDVYAIYEDGQWQEVISYLIIGEDQAMLWDTGLGIGDIRSVVEKLTDLPVFVLVSHSHNDHIGGISQFDEVWCYDSETTVEKLTAGASHEDVAGEVAEGTVWKEFPDGFDPETYEEPGKAPTHTVKEGDVIDLGGRTLEVVWTPGHTADSIMLIDEENGLLFTGDTYYPAPLYAFSADSDLSEYTESMRKIADKVKDMDLDWIYASHNEVVEGTEILSEVADDMQMILDGEKTDYELGDDGLRYYDFEDNVRIVTLDDID